MREPTPSAMTCSDFELLLSDALDGVLSGPKQQDFNAHATQCPQCGPLYFAAREGLAWLKTLPQAEPPVSLISNILAATTGTTSREPRALPSVVVAGARPQWLPVPKRLGWATMLSTLAQPRVAMSFGMAFFSITLILNVAGLQMKDLRHLDLRPGAIARQFYATQSRMVKYYENMRFLYEFQARVQDLKKAAETPRSSTPPAEKKPKPEGRGSSKNDRGNSIDERGTAKKDSSPEGLEHYPSPGDRDTAPAENGTPRINVDGDSVVASGHTDTNQFYSGTNPLYSSTNPLSILPMSCGRISAKQWAARNINGSFIG